MELYADELGPGAGGWREGEGHAGAGPEPRSEGRGGGLWPGRIGECPDVWALASGEGRGSLQERLPL